MSNALFRALLIVMLHIQKAVQAVSAAGGASSLTTSITDGCCLYVARLTTTSRMPQTTAPGTVAPKPNGVPASFQPTQTTKPPTMAAITPAFVAFFQ